MALARKYYQNWARLESTYVLLKDFQTAYIHACRIKSIKFLMALANHRIQGNDIVYKLPEHAEDGIRQAIATIEL
jgi:hypothetical protein